MTSNALAGTAVSLRESYAGNLSFELTGASFRTTPNSVSACTYGTSASNRMDSIPTNATIERAYLYWAASSSNATADDQVIFNGQTINADRTYSHYTGQWYFTNAVADVTTLVSTSRNANYTMSGLTIYSTQAHCNTQVTLGGWALMVIYEDDDEDFRVLNLFEGFEYFRYNSLTLNPDNFQLPSNPNGKHAHITWEGDDSLGGNSEFLTFEGNALGSQPFDSFSNTQGGLTTYGVDIDEYDISAYLNQGDTQVSTTYSAGQDGVLLSAEIMSVSNIPVADLSVTSSTPSAWLESSTVNKTFTITNNGPNDVPTDSVRVSIELEDNLNFNGSVSDSDWVCTNSSSPSGNPLLECTYQNKLRSGWSDYLTLSFDVANAPGNNADLTVTVDHDQAPYDIFDNQQSNDVWSASTPITNIATVDLSASSKTYTNLSGDLILAGDTLQYTITIDDASDLAASNITVTDDLPANISAYTVVSAPVTPTFTAGGANGEGTLTFSGISLAAGTGAGSTQTIILEVTVDVNAEEQASLQNTANISYGSESWLVDTGNITVIEPDLSPSTLDAVDINGGLLEPGDTMAVTITLDETYDLDISDLQLLMNLPSVINAYNITAIPVGASDNSASQIDIQDIAFLSAENATIEFEITIDPATSNDTEFSLSSILNLGSANWIINSDTYRVMDGTPAAAGNKQLYLTTSSTMSRSLPIDGTVTITDEGSHSWSLTPALQADLTFSLTDIAIEMGFEGNRYRNNGNPRTSTPDLSFELRDDNNNLIASKTVDRFTIQPNVIEPLAEVLDKNPAITEDEMTLSAGQQLILTISSADGNSSVQSDRNATLHILDAIDNNLKADGYSAVILNASTVISVDKIEILNLPFNDTDSDFMDDSGANLITDSQPDTTLSVRASISDPFGAFDVSAANINITKSNGTSLLTNEAMTAIDDPSDDQASNSKQYEATFTLLEENEITGGWTISVTGLEGTEGDVEHTRTIGFLINPFLPNIALEKSVKVSSDPINGTANPKAIPEAEILYTIKAINTGRGKSDDGSIILEDEIPENSELYISHLSCDNLDPELTLTNNNNGPVCFLTGTTPNESGLSLNFASIKDNNDNVWFAKDDKDFSYEPDDSSDYDSAIRYIRVKLDGEFNNQAKGSTDEPKFGLTYKVKIK